MAHTTCTVCGRGVDIEESYRCNACKHYVHPECFDYKVGMCDDCSKEND